MAKLIRITVEGKTYDVTVEVVGDTAAVTNIAPAAAPAAARPAVAAAAAPVAAPAPVAAAAPVAAGAGDVTCPMAGLIQKVYVSVGQAVKSGDKVVTFEAMKMSSDVFATASGTVTAIHVKPGDSVQEGQPLLSVG
jgi:biotin carboxyl carrier protein